MGYYTVDTDYLSKFLDETISDKSRFKPLKDDIINILFLDVDVSDTIENKYKDGYWLYESKDPSQLYFRDTKRHIRVKDLAVDFIKRVFSGELLSAIAELFGDNNSTNIFTAALFGIETIVYIKHLVKDYIVKLNNNEYCIYLKLVTHYFEHKTFSLSDVNDMFKNDKCDMHTKWDCEFFESEICKITDEQISNSINSMVERKILIKIDEDVFKIRY